MKYIKREVILLSVYVPCMIISSAICDSWLLRFLFGCFALYMIFRSEKFLDEIIELMTEGKRKLLIRKREQSVRRAFRSLRKRHEEMQEPNP